MFLGAHLGDLACVWVFYPFFFAKSRWNRSALAANISPVTGGPISGLKVYSISSFFGGSYFFLSACFCIVGGISAFANAISAAFLIRSPRFSSSCSFFFAKIKTEQALGIGLALKAGLSRPAFSAAAMSAAFLAILCFSASQNLNGASLCLVICTDWALTAYLLARSASWMFAYRGISTSGGIGLLLNWCLTSASSSSRRSCTIASTLRSLIVLPFPLSLMSKPKGFGTVTPYLPFVALVAAALAA